MFKSQRLSVTAKVLTGLIVVVLAAGAVLAISSLGKGGEERPKVWSEEHQHYHDAP